MIIEKASIQRRIARLPERGSFFKVAREYVKGELSKRRCSHCHWTGSQKCTSCHGKGMIVGEGWFIPGRTQICPEPCRRCIGTGREACQCCCPTLSNVPIAAPHY
jgi:hypothetical protein